MAYELTLSDGANDAADIAIVTGLIQFNDSVIGPAEAGRLRVTISDPDGTVVGGLVGDTARGWLHVQLLFVPEAARGQGLGRRVMAMAETEAKRRGCIGVWLDTFEFQARGFYEKLGYRCFGEIANYLPGNARYFLEKSLVSDER